MKKTKGTITVLLVLAILILGVGYALSNTELNINGTLGLTADQANFKVKFTEARKRDPSVTSENIEPTVTPAITNDLLATFIVKNFTCVDDSVVLEYDVTNESDDLKATVTAAVKSDFGNKEYFTVVPSFTDGSSNPTTTINAGDTATLYVTVKCIKTPTSNVEDAITNGIITLTAAPVEAT